MQKYIFFQYTQVKNKMLQKGDWSLGTNNQPLKLEIDKRLQVGGDKLVEHEHEHQHTMPMSQIGIKAKLTRYHLFHLSGSQWMTMPTAKSTKTRQ